MRIAPCLAVLGSLVLAGCDSSSSEGAPPGPGAAREAKATPEQVADQFLSAVKAQDEVAASALFTAKAREAWGGGEGFQMEGEAMQSWTVGDAAVTGPEASVPVTSVMDGKEEHLSLKMRQEDQQWRIHGMGLDLGGTEMTVDLEQMGSLMEGLASGLEESLKEAFDPERFGPSAEDVAAERARFDAVAPLTAEEAAAAWSVDQDFDQVSALDALRAVAAGLALDPKGHKEALARPVTVRVKGLSRLEALERIAAEVGLHPVYPDSRFLMGPTLPMVQFAEGPRPLPHRFVGPFLVAVEQVEENAPSPTGSVVLAVRALGLPDRVVALMSGMSELLGVGRVVDAQDRNLNADEGVSYLSSPQIQGPLVTESLSLDLRGLLRDVTAIAHLEGTVHLKLPGLVVAGSLESLSEDVRQTLDGLEVRWKAAQGSLDVRGPEDVVQDLSVMFGPKDAAGAPLPAGHAMAMAFGGQLQASFQAEGAASADFKLVRTTTLDFPFDLAGTPLVKAAEQPEALTELSFTGAAPITVEFLSWDDSNPDFPNARLRITSTCNKPVEQAQVTFHYQDQAGAELKDFPHSLAGEFTFEGPKPLAAPGETSEQDVTAFFRPEGTHGLVVEVTAVTFLDGTGWSADQGN